MKIPRISDAMTHIDDRLIIEATNRKPTHKIWIKWISLAACLAVAVISVTMLQGQKQLNPIDKRYKQFNVLTEDIAILWSWEDLTESERSYTTEIDGIKYEKNSGYNVPEESISDKIGTYEFYGYDPITDQKHLSDFDVYLLKGIDKSQFVAAKINDDYYAFKNSVYVKPDNLGELFEMVDLSQFFKLEHFSENGSGPSYNHFVLNSDDAYIWDILRSCKDSAFINDEHWHQYDRDFISFEISCEAMGIYKHTIIITKDGYLYTNVYNWAYLFDIGEDASNKIIKYAKKNSNKSEFTPYENSIYGEIIKITDDYILINDSVLCSNPEDGITHKVLLNRPNISRYINKGYIKMGDIVQITYRGEIQKGSENIVDFATNISEATIAYNTTIIEE